MATSRTAPARPGRRRIGVGLALALALAVATAAGGLATARSRDRGRALASSRSARAALASRDLDAAADAARRWAEASPGSAEAHLLRARVAFARERPAEVADELALAERLGHEPEAVDRLKAAILAQAGRFAEAEPVLRRALPETSEPEVAEGLAKILLATYRLGAARGVLARWRALAPGDPRPDLWLADLDLRTQAEPAVLLGHYERALRVDPGCVEARLGRAGQLLRLHRNAEAAEEFDRYLAARPDDPAARVAAARNAAEMGDDRAAAEHLRRALAAAPDDPAALVEQAAGEARRGDLDAALGHLRRAIEVDPFDLDAAQRLAPILARLGRGEEAAAASASARRIRADRDRLDEIQAALARSPDDPALRLEATRWLFDHGRPREALAWAEQTLRLRPRDRSTLGLLVAYYEKVNNPGLRNYYRQQMPD